MISKKWYIEFLVVLIMIGGAIIFALNINFSSEDTVFHVSKSNKDTAQAIAPRAITLNLMAQDPL